jgi:hypothetical protein
LDHAELEIGRVGEMAAPRGFEKDLYAFDPDLQLKWDRPSQRWTVVQKTRRNRPIGEWDGGSLTEVHDAEYVVFALDEGETPDRRILSHLYDRRGFDREMRQARILRDVKRQKAERENQVKAQFEPAKESLDRGAHELRKKGFAGASPKFTPPSKGWLSEASA